MYLNDLVFRPEKNYSYRLLTDFIKLLDTELSYKEDWTRQEIVLKISQCVLKVLSDS